MSMYHDRLKIEEKFGGVVLTVTRSSDFAEEKTFGGLFRHDSLGGIFTKNEFPHVLNSLLEAGIVKGDDRVKFQVVLKENSIDLVIKLDVFRGYWRIFDFELELDNGNQPVSATFPLSPPNRNIDDSKHNYEPKLEDPSISQDMSQNPKNFVSDQRYYMPKATAVAKSSDSGQDSDRYNVPESVTVRTGAAAGGGREDERYNVPESETVHSGSDTPPDLPALDKDPRYNTAEGKDFKENVGRRPAPSHVQPSSQLPLVSQDSFNPDRAPGTRAVADPSSAEQSGTSKTGRSIEVQGGSHIAPRDASHNPKLPSSDFRSGIDPVFTDTERKRDDLRYVASENRYSAGDDPKYSAADASKTGGSSHLASLDDEGRYTVADGAAVRKTNQAGDGSQRYNTAGADSVGPAESHTPKSNTPKRSPQAPRRLVPSLRISALTRGLSPVAEASPAGFRPGDTITPEPHAQLLRQSLSYEADYGKEQERPPPFKKSTQIHEPPQEEYQPIEAKVYDLTSSDPKSSVYRPKGYVSSMVPRQRYGPLLAEQSTDENHNCYLIRDSTPKDGNVLPDPTIFVLSYLGDANQPKFKRIKRNDAGKFEPPLPIGDKKQFDSVEACVKAILPDGVPISRF